MKAADLNILGGLFGDFQQGVNFGRSIQDGNQARRLREQENARQERQLRMQMAQAQVQAEKARQEMQYKPKEYELDVEKHKTTQGRLQHDIDTLGWNKEKFEEEGRRSDTAFGRKVTQDIAGGLKSPVAIAQAYGLTPEVLGTPEGQAQLRALQAQDFKTQLSQGVTQASAEATARQAAATKGAMDRYGLKEGQVAKAKASTEMANVDRTATDIIKRLVGQGKEDYEIVPQLKAQLSVAKEIMRKKTEAGGFVSTGDLSVLTALEAQIQARSPGGQNVAAPVQPQTPVQQYQQPIGPMPSQGAESPIDSMEDDDLLNLRASLKKDLGS